MRFYLDADLSPAIAVLGREQFGLDIVSSHELGLRRAHDEMQLIHATAAGRCVVTNNLRDFLRWDARFDARGLEHCGILITTHTVSIRDFYAVAKALAYYHHVIHPAPFTPRLVDWLHEAPVDWQPPAPEAGP
jgi:predicted nuclease of predicted toxin-antitoxin system